MADEQNPVGDEPRPVKANKRRGTTRKPRNLNLKQVRTLKRLPKANSVAEAADGIYGTRQAAYRGLQRAYATAPEVLAKIGVTREQILGKIANLMICAHRPGLYGNIPENGVQLKAAIHLNKAFKAGDDKATGEGERVPASGRSLSLVFTHQGAAREFVEAISSRRSTDGFIDVDAEVDPNLGRARHSESVQAVP